MSNLSWYSKLLHFNLRSLSDSFFWQTTFASGNGTGEWVLFILQTYVFDDHIVPLYDLLPIGTHIMAGHQNLPFERRNARHFQKRRSLIHLIRRVRLLVDYVFGRRKTDELVIGCLSH